MLFVRNTSFLGFYCANLFFFWCAFCVYLKSLNGIPAFDC